MCYAHNGDVAIAYQVFGEGPISLVCVPGFVSNLYWNWELPEFKGMCSPGWAPSLVWQSWTGAELACPTGSTPKTCRLWRW